MMKEKAHGPDAATSSSALQAGEQESEKKAASARLNFSDPKEREAHVRAFWAWLPKELHHAPDMHWERLSSQVMGYLIRNVANSPDAKAIAFATGCIIGAVKKRTVASYCAHLTYLLRQLRASYGMQSLTDLRSRQIWERFIEGRTPTSGEIRLLLTYDSVAFTHIRTYLEGLDVRQRTIWEAYALPPLPANFTEKHGLTSSQTVAAARHRKEQSDVLLPLFPLLIEIAQLRKQAAERLVKEFRRHRDRAIAGEIELPYQFEYKDRLISVSKEAPTISAVEVIEREVTLSFTLWDRVSWVRSQPKRYSRHVQWKQQAQVGVYSPERTMYFLQYHGESSDLLWCGDLIAHNLLWKTARPPSWQPAENREDVTYEEFRITRPGLLSPVKADGLWLRRIKRPDEVLFEPESLYRGILYAAALATVALTNGCRLSELLQISATRFETIAVDELKNQQPTGRKIGILVQNLLPKGYTKESDRQFFLIGELAGRLLAEIGRLLEATHAGGVPVVHPYQSTKEEDLVPEPYLFQWDAKDDGRIGLLVGTDVAHLLRFLFHGLDLATRTGKPIRVVPHLLRHVLATHARTVKNVPAEAVAYLLHHRVHLSSSRHALSISEATAYYSRMTLEQVLALLFEGHHTDSCVKKPQQQVPLLSS